MAQKKKAAKPKTASTRVRKTPHYRHFRLHRRIKTTLPPLPGAFRLFGRSLRHMWCHWKLFGGILLIYGLIRLALGLGIGTGISLSDLKPTVDQLFQGTIGRFSSGVTLFGLLLSSTSSATTATASAYQGVIVLAISLALVWALRQSLAKESTQPRLRDAFYKGMYPMVPFLLVLVVVGIQLLPMAIGGSLYNQVISNGIAVTAIEKVLWLLLFILLALLSLYMVSSSLFALYIVTLPDMTPMKALRSARQLVLHRRWLVLRKIIFLPIALIVLAGIIIIPLIVLATRLAEGAFFIYTTIGLAIIHSYMYQLYRELL